MKFIKMHGIGNDYVYVDCFNQPIPPDPPALARAVSDRHFGIGSDGLILVCRSEKADARMRMFNADGSESEMCGNGVRCVAKLAHDHGLVSNNPLTVETGRGVLTLHLTLKTINQTLGEGPSHTTVDQVAVDMGTPILESERIPTTLPGPRVVDHPLAEKADWHAACGLDPRFTCVSMGNPHAVLYCADVALVPLEQVGPVLERAAIFPRRINVHFVQVVSRGEVIMRTWERGSGITLACGTGACAVAVAGVLTGRTERDLLAHLPGGDLRLQWNEATDRVIMTGPATEVFAGEWPSR